MKNETHGLTSFGEALTTYPDENSLEMKGYTFAGDLMTVQKLKFVSDNEVEGYLETYQGGNTIKAWERSKKRE